MIEPTPRPRARRLALVTCLLGAFVLAGCGGGDEESSTTPTTVAAGGATVVDIVSSGSTWKFRPDSVTVSTGTSVTWTNSTDVPHNVVFTDAAVRSSDLFNKGKSFTTTAGQAGTFPYICSVHPDMKGTLVVQ